MKSDGNKKGLLEALFRLIPILFRMVPVALCVLLLINAVTGVMWGAITWAQQRFFDAAGGLLAGTPERSIWLSLMEIVLVYILCQCMSGIGSAFPSYVYEKCRIQLLHGIHQKAERVDSVCFEDTERLDDINKAANGAEMAFGSAYSLLYTLSYYCPYFIFMAVYLSSVKPALMWAILLAAVPALFSQIIRAKTYADLENQSAPIRREFEYYEQCLAGREYFKETRQLGAFEYFHKLYMDSLVAMNKIRFRAKFKAGLWDLTANLLSAGGFVIVLLILFRALMNGEVTIGAFAAVYASICRIFLLMGYAVEQLTSTSEVAGSVRNYLNFMDLPEREGNVREPASGDIVLENVSFAYPRAGRKALDGINLTLREGETLAIVGENGSGKTTLVRLLTGLYLPTEGDVTHAGISTRSLSMGALFAHTSGVFQKYHRYQMTLRENLTISSIQKTVTDEELDRVGAMAGLNGSDPSFTDGYDTMLSREFDGVDLSGGQWQRIAIGRGFWRDHKLIILDEPTAAIDPLEESRVYNRFAEVSHGKTAVIVTHRLGSVRLADRIVVLKEGCIAELGTHDELLAAHGEYARIYESQRQWYT